MATMPNVVGLELGTAQALLQTAGVIVPSSIGYFGVWPITPIWQLSSQPASTVLSQSIGSGNTVAPNAPITLGVSRLSVSVCFP